MDEIVYCSSCKSNGRSNRCYITGYNTKCGHNVGLAYGHNKNGSTIMKCGYCSGNNQCYITGYDYKCGHDCGWAYEPEQKNATCYNCGKALNGKWSMENNPSNNGYFHTTTGRYLGISDGYFLYGDSPNWVYSYCKPCWIKEIQKILPRLGLNTNDNQEQLTNLKNKNSELQNIINNKNQEIEQLNGKIREKDEKIKNIEDEINKLKETIKSKNKEIENLNKTPIDLKNFETLFNQNIIDFEIEKLKNILKSSNIEEISNLDKLFSYDVIFKKTIEEFNNVCKIKIKETIKEIIEKLCIGVDKIKMNINNISLIIDDVKKKLNVKEIPENVANESILPLKKLVEEKSEKTEKMNQIKEEINKMYLKLVD